MKLSFPVRAGCTAANTHRHCAIVLEIVFVDLKYRKFEFSIMVIVKEDIKFNNYSS